jgi:LysR family glycine cleavage system transcriptional activator
MTGEGGEEAVVPCGLVELAERTGTALGQARHDKMKCTYGTAGGEGIDPACAIWLEQSSLVLPAAIEEQGVALGNTSLVMEDLAAGRLIRPFDLALRGPFGFHLISSRSTAGRPLAKAFRTWVLQKVTAAGELAPTR